MRRRVSVAGKMFRAGEHSGLSQSFIKGGAHSSNFERLDAKTSVLCYRAFGVHMQIQHRREIQIASGGAKFHGHGSRHFFGQLQIADAAHLCRRGPLSEWFSQGEARTALLIDADQHRASGGPANLRRKIPKRVDARIIPLVNDYACHASRKISSEFGWQGIALKAEHEPCKYGITCTRFGLGW